MGWVKQETYISPLDLGWTYDSLLLPMVKQYTIIPVLPRICRLLIKCQQS